MNSLGTILGNIRESVGMSLNDVQNLTGINTSYLSRIETGKRIPTRKQIETLATTYKCNEGMLMNYRDSEKIISELGNIERLSSVLGIIKQRISPSLTDFTNFISIRNRRYIGNKAKLLDWIDSIISKNIKSANSFFDVFAGSGVVSDYFSSKFDNIIVNDFLYSNEIIYKAFFGTSDFPQNKVNKTIEYYNEIDEKKLKENYFSKNFGGKFFSINVAKKIGFIRNDIEKNKKNLSEREYCILLTTLIYNIDKIANTVGHFDAYIKKEIKENKLILKPILIDNRNCNFEIYRADSNLLAKKITADIAYIDPPYNSRQYSRFYHLYETLVKWNKPKLYGVAMKPKPENMSCYCTVNARDAFKELIENLNVRYILTSYNNTYNSKSSSSENKISLGDLEKILKSKGKTKVFKHNYKFFNTGKTDFSNHMEYLFLTKAL